MKRLVPLFGLAAILIWGTSGCAASGEVEVSTSEVPPADPSLGDAWVRPADGTVMVYVPGGTFQMGSDESDPDADDDEFPQHPVTLDGFWIDRTEVTNAQFAAFLNAQGDRAENGARYIEVNQGYCRIEQADGDRLAVHSLKDALKVLLLERQHLVQGRLAFLVCLGHDHAHDGVAGSLVKEHVLGAAQANALGTKVYRTLRVYRIVGIRAHSKGADFIGPTQQPSHSPNFALFPPP